MSAFLTPAEIGLVSGKCLPSPEAVQREVSMLRARLDSHRQRRAELVRNLYLNVPHDIPGTERQVAMLDRAILCLARKIAKLEHRVGPSPLIDRDWTRGKLLSAEARGLAGVESAADLFPPLPLSASGMADEECVSEQYVVLPEFVISAQAPAERVFDNSVGFEAGGDAVDQSASQEISFENLTGGESFEGVQILDGLNSEGAVDAEGDGVDAGGQEDMTTVVQTDFASDEGAIDGSELVEPGQAQQPQDAVPARVEQVIPPQSRLNQARPQARQQAPRQIQQRQAPRNCAPLNRPTLANAHRFRQGNGAVSSLPFRGQGAGATGHQANGMGRLDVQRALLRRQQATGMGQAPVFNIASKLVDAAANVGTAAVQARTGFTVNASAEARANDASFNNASGQAGAPAAQSAVSKYMPLIVLGGGAILATAAYFAFFRKNSKKDD